MRVIVPLFEDAAGEKRLETLARMPWQKDTVLGATLKGVQRLGPDEVLVASNVPSLVELARRESVRAECLTGPDRFAEKFMPPGSLYALSHFGPRHRDLTLLLWFATPWMNEAVLHRLVSHMDAQNAAILQTARLCHDHPAQCFEGFNLLGSYLFLPVARSDAKDGALVSGPFPFDWPTRQLGHDGGCFKREATLNRVVYVPAPPHPDTWPAEGVWEKLDATRARRWIRKEAYRWDSRPGPLHPAALCLNGAGQAKAVLLRDAASGLDFLALPANLTGRDLRAKAWRVSGRQAVPWLMNGVSLAGEHAAGAVLETGAPERLMAFQLPALPQDEPLLVWITEHGTGSSDMQIPWVPEGADWGVDDFLRPYHSATGEYIFGRQMFTPLYQPDGQAMLINPGVGLEREPALREPAETLFPADAVFPPVIRNFLDLMKAELFFP